ncbi:MAG: phosphate ABC transporter substrate-binding protein [Lentimicrobiaceae bacterium]|nr:phosphate ABC transporter substrate-binding protein [Lentimicrobiaceae bacterium]
MFKTVKSLVVGLALVALINPFANAQVVIKGSDTCLPVSQQEAEAFGKKGGGAVTVTGGGSGVGISALISGTCDIAQASRPMKFDEKQKMSEAGKTPKEVIIAYDALAVVINPENPVNQLTRQQLEQIFTGKITNWKEVGGPDMKIVVYSRETSSGTYEFFKEHVMKNKNYATSVLSMPATGAIIQSVKQTKGAIGYVGLAYLNKEVKALKVSYDGKTFVEPSVANAKNKTYPVVRPLFYYYSINNEKKVKPFMDFVLSPEGQKIVENVGFIGIKN